VQEQKWRYSLEPFVKTASSRGGQRSLEPLLQLEDPPTAAVCFNDLVALGVMATLERSGKKPGAEKLTEIQRKVLRLVR
jgi:DNA-binding LacI/PurR family transcriptional regulator